MKSKICDHCGMELCASREGWIHSAPNECRDVLKAKLAVAEDGLAKRDAHIGAHKRENIKLTAENARLREALEFFALPESPVRSTARQALEAIASSPVPRLACSRCGEEIAQSYQPGRCYDDQSEPDLMDSHDEAEPWEEVHGEEKR